MSAEDSDDRGFSYELLEGFYSRKPLDVKTGAAVADALSKRSAADPLVVLNLYWSGLGAGDARPRPADVNPADISSRVLGHVVILDVEEDGPRRYRYRLVGTAVEAVFGGDYTGRYMDEFVHGEFYERVRAAYDLVCDEKVPVMFSGAYIRRSGDLYEVSRIALPLFSDAGTVERILTAVVREGDAISFA